MSVAIMFQKNYPHYQVVCCEYGGMGALVGLHQEVMFAGNTITLDCIVP